MDINELERSSIAKFQSGEDFLIHVAEFMERQLKEWDNIYEVFVMKLANYDFIVKNEEKYYEVQLSEDDIASLQKSGPYELDRKLWKELENQGLPIIKGTGNYIEKVL